MKVKFQPKRQVAGVRIRLKKMMKCILLGKQVKENEKFESSESSLATRDYSASGYSSRVGEIKTKTDNTSTIDEAESTLRESGYLNYEEARALLGRLEYQKGNMEGAFHVFDGIAIDNVIPNIKVSLARRCEPQRHHSQSDAMSTMSIHAISLLFEAIFLKAKSLQALGRFKESAQSCQVILETVESSIPEGLNGRFAINYKLVETLNNAVELLPELWILAGVPHEAILSYRRALLYNWNLELDTRTRIEMKFAVFLLYSGIEANPVTLRFQVDGAFTPKNNIEEAILILLILLKKFLQRRMDWDPLIMDHLSFALSMSGDLQTLACQLEELPANTMDKNEKHSVLAMCYHGEGEDLVALNLFRNLLNDHRFLKCTQELLFASKICAGHTIYYEEGIQYANRAADKLEGDCEQLVSNAICSLGILSSVQSKYVASDSKRVLMQSEALNALESAKKLTKGTNSNVIYHLSLENAEQRKLEPALSYAKKLIKLEAGCNTRGWILLARILSGHKRYADAETIINAGLEQTGKWEHADLLRTKAKLQISQGQMKNAIQTYTHLLAVLQVRKRSFGVGKKLLQRKDHDRRLEIETWHDLADVYTSLSQWHDAEICLSKSEALSPSSVSLSHSRGLLYEARGLNQKAQQSFWEALNKEPNHVPSLISMANSLMHLGGSSLPVAKTLVRRAIRLDRTNHTAWYILGRLHKSDPTSSSLLDAVECHEAALLLEETSPVEHFSG